MEGRHQDYHEYDNHLTLDDIRDGLIDVIYYNKTVGRLLNYLLAEVGRLASEANQQHPSKASPNTDTHPARICTRLAFY